jgi:DNA-binding HxlR family transcriptional regulator
MDSINPIATKEGAGARRIYRHFCMIARTLEVVGERWSLLIVRDLLFGPRRFTDLARGLHDITPTRLTERLRRLEKAGIVTRQPQSGGREVWYALTEAGAALEPVLEGLTLWGIEHAHEEPLPDEPAHPEPVMLGSKVVLERFAPQPDGRSVWVWRLTGDDAFTIRSDAGKWTIVRGEAGEPDVVVEATATAWARFLTSARPRQLPQDDIRLSGKRTAQARLARAFDARLKR